MRPVEPATSCHTFGPRGGDNALRRGPSQVRVLVLRRRPRNRTAICNRALNHVLEYPPTAIRLGSIRLEFLARIVVVGRTMAS
jgi:hypothetical protein